MASGKNIVVGGLRVHVYPTPPNTFDLTSAGAKELELYGIPPRPDKQQRPVEAANWFQVYRDYIQSEHVAPRFRAVKRRYTVNHPTPALNGGVAKRTSKNWSGS